jgi:hypothetical protein
MFVRQALYQLYQVPQSFCFQFYFSDRASELACDGSPPTLVSGIVGNLGCATMSVLLS